MLIELKNAIKNKVLFRSEDGVDIYEGDVVYRVSNSDGELFKTPSIVSTYNWHWYEENYKLKGQHPNHKHFSTKEAAKEYVLMNKPCLSLNDVAEIYKTANISMKEYNLKKMKNQNQDQGVKLIDLVKEKLNIK